MGLTLLCKIFHRSCWMWGIFCIILLVLHNTLMDLNNVMEGLQRQLINERILFICCKCSLKVGSYILWKESLICWVALVGIGLKVSGFATEMLHQVAWLWTNIPPSGLENKKPKTKNKNKNKKNPKKYFSFAITPSKGYNACY